MAFIDWDVDGLSVLAMINITIDRNSVPMSLNLVILICFFVMLYMNILWYVVYDGVSRRESIYFKIAYLSY